MRIRSRKRASLTIPPYLHLLMTKKTTDSLKKAQNKAIVIAAHSGMKAGTVSERDFLTTTRKFILMKVQGGLKEFTKHGMTEEDVTQNALIKMCAALPRFEGTSEDYFYWLQRVVYSAVLDAYGLHQGRQQTVPIVCCE